MGQRCGGKEFGICSDEKEAFAVDGNERIMARELCRDILEPVFFRAGEQEDPMVGTSPGSGP